MTGEGILVGGEPMAILAASSSIYEVATRTNVVAGRLAGALVDAATTIAATAPFAPARAADVSLAVTDVMVSPTAGLGSVGVSLLAASQFLRQAGQALEVAGAVGVVARGFQALRHGGVPEILSSVDGLDLRRESFSARIAWPGVTSSTNLGVRQVQQKDGSILYVVERTQGGSAGASYGAQINGVGLFADISSGGDSTERWAVRTPEDVDKMVALLTLGLVTGHLTPAPTEMTESVFDTVTLVGAGSAGTATIRGEQTTDRAGTQRFSAILGGTAVLGIAGIGGSVGTGGAGSVKVTIERSPVGVISKLSVTTTTEVDRGRHGNPLIEAGNREATLTEISREVVLTPEHRAAAERIADDLADGRPASDADLEAVTRDATATRRVYDVRHQSYSGDVAIDPYEGGGGASIDTAVLRKP